MTDAPPTPPPGRRGGRLLLPLLAFLAGTVGLIVAAAVVFMPGPVPRGPSVGGPFALVDQNGRKVTEAALEGSPSLIFFGFTHCPDVCPTTLFDVTQVFSAMGPKADRAKAFFITVDPERDTPALLKEYLTSFDPRISGLTGDRAAIDAVEKAYRVYARKVPLEGGEYTMDHTALVYLMDKKGQFVGAFNLQRPPADSARELEKYL
ncbi:SCO family protein [Alsobacter sp. SYSU M60028]|uniref:SCO family protein n=1 Tax=Alsobacter ponti TaxID=2962936 RepID=A0ABT1LJL9_9HYPH|nr:SCO family protein [Alsobacter ponti]MCP8941093.1 SCO family protein [Alsobacter ponti]